MRRLVFPILLAIAIPLTAFGYAHPNLTDAQQLIDQSFAKITRAQETNDFDLEGHAVKAKDALEKAKGEISLAAAYADKNSVFAKFLKGIGFHATPNGEPPQANISKKKHPALAEAQQSIFEAYEKLVKAQEANEFDMDGHAQKAKDLLDDAAKELKEAAKAANKR
jgi:hypothetical protein